MSHRIALAAALLLSAAAPVFAQDAAPAPSPESKPVVDPARDDAKVDRFCLRETGTHIRTRAKSNARGDCTSVRAGRVYTQEDLRMTGELDIADALRRLDTSIR